LWRVLAAVVLVAFSLYLSDPVVAMMHLGLLVFAPVSFPLI
jgi:hypothetical protein